MIECIFTIDYEIFSNGEGSLRELVYAPSHRLIGIFKRLNKRFVVFIEAAELEMIEAIGTDPAVHLVKDQIRDLYNEGFELGLHLHPQWFNAKYENGNWLLDYSEYNLCTLKRERIAQIVDRAIAYLREVLGVSEFTPLSFRAGNWLFQPTQTAAKVLAERGIKVDSSVFKGGLQYQNNLDYRPARRNGYYWRFMNDVNVSDPQGDLLELPIHTHKVLTLKLLTGKRVSSQRKSFSTFQSNRQRLIRLLDFLRFWYPVKLDFSCMGIDELTSVIDRVIREEKKNPISYKPVVAIGHTKELVDFETVESFLSYLGQKGIAVSTFEEVYEKCK